MAPANECLIRRLGVADSPVGAPAGSAECGRVVLTDLHINSTTPLGGGDDSEPDEPFPTGCADTPFSAQALAMAYVFFDLSACVTALSAAAGAANHPPMGALELPALARQVLARARRLSPALPTRRRNVQRFSEMRRCVTERHEL